MTHSDKDYIEARQAGYSAGLFDGFWLTDYLPCRCDICLDGYQAAFDEGVIDAIEGCDEMVARDNAEKFGWKPPTDEDEGIAH